MIQKWRCFKRIYFRQESLNATHLRWFLLYLIESMLLIQCELECDITVIIPFIFIVWRLIVIYLVYIFISKIHRGCVTIAKERKISPFNYRKDIKERSICWHSRTAATSKARGNAGRSRDRVTIVTSCEVIGTKKSGWTTIQTFKYHENLPLEMPFTLILDHSL